MAIISASSVRKQLAALQQLLDQATNQVASLQSQLQNAQNRQSQLQSQVAALNSLASAISAIDQFTTTAFQWTQDPVTNVWTGIPVKFPGVPASNIAVYGGTGSTPVLQPPPQSQNPSP